MRKIICRIIEGLFPNKVAELKAERKAQREAMQDLLNVSRKMREEHGFSVESINDRLRPALLEYKRGRYDSARDYAHSQIFTCIAI